MIATFSTKINVRFVLFVCLFSGESKLYLKQTTCCIFLLQYGSGYTPSWVKTKYGAWYLNPATWTKRTPDEVSPSCGPIHNTWSHLDPTNVIKMDGSKCNFIVHVANMTQLSTFGSGSRQVAKVMIDY